MIFEDRLVFIYELLAVNWLLWVNGDELVMKIGLKISFYSLWETG